MGKSIEINSPITDHQSRDRVGKSEKCIVNSEWKIDHRSTIPSRCGMNMVRHLQAPPAFKNSVMGNSWQV
jgi:hypothetical protein